MAVPLNYAGLRQLRDRIIADPARGHVGSRYLTGLNQIETGDLAEEI
jgi:hypothetical protein